MRLLAGIPGTAYWEDSFSQNFNEQLDRLQFDMIAAHIRFITTATMAPTLSPEDILASGVATPELQCNTIYFYCELGQYDPKSDVLNRLKGGIHLDYTPLLVQVACTLMDMEREIIPIRNKIRKDIVFNEEGTGVEIGWYNFYANILWLGDLGYDLARLVTVLHTVLAAIENFKQYGKEDIALTIVGADPEFELVHARTGGLILPGEFIDDPEQKTLIGIDRYPEIGELRPPPGVSPLALKRNIKRLLRNLIRSVITLEDVRIQGGGGKVRNTGGHLHFNVNMESVRVKHILHDLIGRWVRAGMASRRKEEGRYMDRDGRDVVRKAENHPGWEWRLLPSFIVSEEMTDMLIIVTWCVLDSIINNVVEEKECHTKDTRDILRNLRLYPYYQRYIDNFIKTFVDKRTALEGLDIRDGWKIKRVTPQNNVSVHSGMAWVRNLFPPVAVDTAVRVRVGIEANQPDAKGMILYVPTPEIVNRLRETLNRIMNDYLMTVFVTVDEGLLYDAYLLLPQTFAYREITQTAYFKLVRTVMMTAVQSLIVHLINYMEEKEETK